MQCICLDLVLDLGGKKSYKRHFGDNGGNLIMDYTLLGIKELLLISLGMIAALGLCRRVSLFLGNTQTYLEVKGQDVCTLLSRVQQNETKQTDKYIY